MKTADEAIAPLNCAECGSVGLVGVLGEAKCLKENGFRMMFSAHCSNYDCRGYDFGSFVRWSSRRDAIIFWNAYQQRIRREA